MNINPTTIQLVRSFLTKRSQFARYQDYSSDYHPTHIGVPQGTILRPLLWNIFVTDLASEVCCRLTLYHTIRKSHRYTTITNSTSQKATIAMTHKPLQVADCAAEWCHENSMLHNSPKSSGVTFRFQKFITAEPIKFHSQAVNADTQTKLLGVTFDPHLRFSTTSGR